MARRGGIGQLLQQVLDEQSVSQNGLAKRLYQENGGTVESWRSQVIRILKGQVPQRRTAILLARALGKEDAFFIPDPPQAVLDAALLTRILDRLEHESAESLAAVAPLLGELADQVGELAFRLRQVVERLDERSHGE